MNKRGKAHGCVTILLIFVAVIVLVMCACIELPNIETDSTTKYIPGVRATMTGNTSNMDHSNDPTATTAYVTPRPTRPITLEPGSSMNNPIDITFDNFSELQDGMFVRVTGPVNAYRTSRGRLSIGGNSGYGLCIHIMNDSGDRYYELEADSIGANGFEDELDSHAPADVSYSPSTVGDWQFCGCTATIVGRIESYTYVIDGSYYSGYRFSSRTNIEALDFYY